MGAMQSSPDLQRKNNMDSKEPICITGIGVGCPLGFDFETVSAALLSGKSGVSHVRHFDASNHPSQIAASIGPIPSPNGISGEVFTKLTAKEKLYLHCASQAVEDAGISREFHRLKTGFITGAGPEWLLSWEDDFLTGGNNILLPGRELRPHEQFAKEHLEIKGPSLQISSACASGNHTLLLATEWLRNGIVDCCIAGACAINVTPLTLASFGNLRALSRRNQDPQKASRPFDKNRDGFVLGEGGALFVLETLDSAMRRGAKPHAFIMGGGCTSDAYHPVTPNPDTSKIEEAIHLALEQSNLKPADIGYINAHGTSTPLGDACEARAIKNLLGESSKKIPVSSTKGMTGHLLAASSAIETVSCIVALKSQMIPPTINLDEPDPECDLFHVPNQSIRHEMSHVLSNSFGFGGSNSCVVFAKA